MSNNRQDDPVSQDGLVQRAKTDREAFGTLYDLYFPVVHRYCRRRSCDVATADDLAADVFLSVARSMRTFAGQTDEDFRRWVYRIATNAIHAHGRKLARRGELWEHVARATHARAEHGALAEESAHASWEVVAHELQLLGEREQTVLSLRYLEGLSYDEVGKVLDARPATLRVLASRALEKLRRKLIPQPDTRAMPLPKRKSS